MSGECNGLMSINSSSSAALSHGKGLLSATRCEPVRLVDVVIGFGSARRSHREAKGWAEREVNLVVLVQVEISRLVLALPAVVITDKR